MCARMHPIVMLHIIIHNLSKIGVAWVWFGHGVGVGSKCP